MLVASTAVRRRLPELHSGIGTTNNSLVSNAGLGVHADDVVVAQPCDEVTAIIVSTLR
jgi:hypothetical protein